MKRASPGERLATLAALRSEQSKPVLDEIRTWLMTQQSAKLCGVEPRAYLREATLRAVPAWDGHARPRPRVTEILSEIGG